jgi:nitric oxide reductase NorQ protein
MSETPYYRALANEVPLFEAAARQRLPVMLKGPTGTGKTRFLRHMAARLGRELHTVACHEDLTAPDLVGRWLITAGETRWLDGPLTRAVRSGGVCYLDEVAEARRDVIVVIHPLADDRRVLPLEQTGELLEAHPDFQLVVSYNPGYQNLMRALKPSTCQRFVAIEFDFPPAEAEAEIVAAETGASAELARRLVALAAKLRPLKERGLEEAPSTRTLVYAAALIGQGIEPLEAVEAAVLRPLTEDPELFAAGLELARMVFGSANERLKLVG